MNKAFSVTSLFLIIVILIGVVITPSDFFGTVNLEIGAFTPLDINKFVHASNSYAIDQYHELRANSTNILFSPYSISTCLSMVYEGAKGETANEMLDVFDWNPEDSKRLTSTGYFIDLLSSKETGCMVNTANAVWARENYPFNRYYIDTIKTAYRGEASNLDFSKSNEALNEINDWVASKTNDKIKDLFEDGMITPSTLMVLVNTVYFIGDWMHQFGSRTTNQNFTVSPDQKVPVKMMYMRDQYFNYAETREAQVLEMEYVDGNYSMIIVLPKTSLEKVERGLTTEKFSEWLGALEDTEMILSFPRFFIEGSYRMKDTLSNLGMPSAFNPSADFSGVSPQGSLWLDDVVHKTFLNVTAEGTETAAATGGVYVMSIPQGIPFRANHPFLFAIIEKETNLILFLGRLVNPS